MCRIKTLCTAFLCVALLGMCGITAHAQEETGTAGSTLGKEVEEHQEAQTYSQARAAGGWILDGNGWWYRYSDGTWAEQSWRRIDGAWYYFDNNGYWSLYSTAAAVV